MRGRGSDLYRIREYMPEDSARHVDWKATAKSGSLKVREFAREDERKLCIAFDNPEPGLISERAYEKAVDLTASLAWHFSTQEAEVSFVVPGRPRTRDLHEFLAWLAVIRAGSMLEQDHPGKAAIHWRSARDMGLGTSDEYNIMITARSAPACLRLCGTLPTWCSLGMMHRQLWLTVCKKRYRAPAPCPACMLETVVPRESARFECWFLQFLPFFFSSRSFQAYTRAPVDAFADADFRTPEVSNADLRPDQGSGHVSGELGHTVLETVRAMVERNIGAVPVLHNGKLVGIFSERDLMKRVVAEGRDPRRPAWPRS